MPVEAVQLIEDQHEIVKEVGTQPHLLVYGWIYLIFVVLTALALYVMFTFPQGEI